MSVLPAQSEKASYVEQMFARIAPGYDRMNRIITFGLDQGWRRLAVELIAPPAGGLALDVGCGTGDFLTFLAARSHLAVGVDYTVPMMVAGQPKLRTLAGQAAFAGGDALRLPFADHTFDTITTGFVLRNVVDIDLALREMWRVARPGARLACLEVARPQNSLLRLGHQLYFEQVVPLLAGLLRADSSAYRYLPQSARAFPPPPELAARLQAAGWGDVHYRLLGLGAAALHIARK